LTRRKRAPGPNLVTLLAETLSEQGIPVRGLDENQPPILFEINNVKCRVQYSNSTWDNTNFYWFGVAAERATEELRQGFREIVLIGARWPDKRVDIFVVPLDVFVEFVSQGPTYGGSWKFNIHTFDQYLRHKGRKMDLRPYQGHLKVLGISPVVLSRMREKLPEEVELRTALPKEKAINYPKPALIQSRTATVPGIGMVRDEPRLDEGSILALLTMLLRLGIDVGSDNMKEGWSQLFRAAERLFGNWEKAMIALARKQTSEGAQA